jgi:chorismate mutase
VIEIARIKKQLHMKVVDPQRELNVFQNVKQANSGPLDNEGFQRIFERIIEECRRIERHITGEK